jgi:excisionase family DNA binding protein
MTRDAVPQSAVPERADADPTEWVTTTEAAALTGYGLQYVRRLVRSGKVRARKWANAWMVDRTDLLRYKREIDALGPAKHDPWRTGARQRDGAG